MRFDAFRTKRVNANEFFSSYRVFTIFFFLFFSLYHEFIVVTYGEFNRDRRYSKKYTLAHN